MVNFRNIIKWFSKGEGKERIRFVDVMFVVFGFVRVF